MDYFRVVVKIKTKLWLQKQYRNKLISQRYMTLAKINATEAGEREFV